ncbi:MAG TPA: hypothetical protein VIG30_01020 [Ktedonobacterales bacterium]
MAHDSTATHSPIRSAQAPIAALDVGSNTVHVVVAQPDAAGADLRVLADEVELVRLGADVALSGAIGPERMARALAAIARQAAIARDHGASAILGLATEGVRAAANGAELLRRARDETGVALALISGEQEAALTYWGAASGLPTAARAAVVDLGGGSLELVLGESERVLWRVSLPLGSGAIHDRLAPADPPDPAQLAAAERHVAAALATLDPPLPAPAAAATGGTATTLAALAHRALPDAAGEPGISGLPNLTEALLAELLALPLRLPAADVARQYGVDEARARLLGAGAVILRAALRRLGADRLRVSRRGVREGAILAHQRHGADWLAAAARG